jgi:hypothetical protein
VTHIDDLIAQAKADLAQLERIKARKSCEAGHSWKSVGGRNAGCDDWCHCSIPVHQCDVCGEIDYGDNEEARDTMAACKRMRAGG